MQRKQQVQIIFVFMFVCVLSVGLSWVWGHSYVYIHNNTPGTKTYRFIDSSGIATSFRSSETVVKRVVKNDTYQIVVQQDEKNFFAVGKTKGLLRSLSIDAKLVREKSRSFVGNNPSPCAYLIGDAMFSAECGDSAYGIKEHLPASGFTPSYSAQLSSNNLFGDLAGIATTQSGESVALLKDTEGVAGYSTQKISAGLAGGDRVRIGALDPDYTYEVRAFGSGVLVYDNSQADYFYINPSNMSWSRIQPESPRTTGLTLVETRTYKDDLAILYTDASVTENLDPENDKTSAVELAGTSEVVIYNHNSKKQTHVVLPNVYSSATTCGQQRLCAIGLTGMTVYDTSETKPKKLYTIAGATDIFETPSSNLHIVSSLGIMSYDPQSDSGSYDYTFGDYRPCGFSPAAGNTYLLCLIDSRQEKIGLLIEDGETTETVPIDKIVLNVLKSKAVSSLSVYRNLVIVTPQYYDPSSGRLTDTNKAKQALGDVINKAAFPEKYLVVNGAEL